MNSFAVLITYMNGGLTEAFEMRELPCKCLTHHVLAHDSVIFIAAITNSVLLKTDYFQSEEDHFPETRQLIDWVPLYCE